MKLSRQGETLRSLARDPSAEDPGRRSSRAWSGVRDPGAAPSRLHRQPDEGTILSRRPVSNRKEDWPAAAAAGRAALGLVVTHALVQSSGCGSDVLDTVKSGYDRLFYGLQWMDDLEDWRDDLEAGRENLLLYEIDRAADLRCADLRHQDQMFPRTAWSSRSLQWRTQSWQIRVREGQSPRRCTRLSDSCSAHPAQDRSRRRHAGQSPPGQGQGPDRGHR